MPKELLDIKLGDWVVYRGRWGVGCVEVGRVTPVKFWHKDVDNWVRQGHRSDVYFVGSQTQCERLCKQLELSQVQLDHDNSAAYDRKRKRDEKFLADAIAAKTAAAA